MSTTAEQRARWGPACSARPDSMRPAYEALNTKLTKWNYAARAGETGAFNCRRITGGTGFSLHSYLDGEQFTLVGGVTISMALAVDINWSANPYGPRLITDMPRGMVDDILSIRTNNDAQVWGWGGYYSGNKDAMHYEIKCSPADLATGIKGGSTAPPLPDPASPPPPAGKCPEPGGHPELKQVANGSAVKHLQHFLIVSGAKITADGDFGPATHKAVINHQIWLRDFKAPSITADGIVGPKTWQAMHNWADGLQI